VDDWAESDLAWELAEELDLTLPGRQRNQLYAAIGAGQSFTAIDTLLQIAAEQHRTVPVELAAKIADSLAGYAHSSEAPRLKALLCAVSPD
jgi:hypothetical protein